MFISEVAYELYKQNWIDTHTSPEMRLKALRDYYQYVDECLDNAEPYESFEKWIYEQGYDGGILYVSFDEFLDLGSILFTLISSTVKYVLLKSIKGFIVLTSSPLLYDENFL